MKRILFVDDETSILDGLQRTLRPQRHLWETAFAPGGEAALAMLEAAPFDVVVSDMRMPGMDGAALLGVVCEKYPGVLRIVLSGQTDLESALRAVPVAHQFLLKPCDSDALCTAIERGTNLAEVFRSKMLVSIVGSLRDLPSVPRTFSELRAALSAPEPSLEAIARIVEKDAAIAAKTLHLVNSAFFGMARNVSDIRTAVTYLGMNLLQNLVLSVEVFRTFQPKKKIPGFSIEEFQAHSHLTAAIATRISQTGGVPPASVVAALLHDTGKLVIAERAPDHFIRALSGAKSEGRPLFEVEEELIGVSHAEVGAYLLSIWGIPFHVVEAVAHHHHPDRVPRAKWDMSTAVYLANFLAHEQTKTAPQETPPAYAPLDDKLLETLGGAQMLTDWREMTRDVAENIARGRK